MVIVHKNFSSYLVFLIQIALASCMKNQRDEVIVTDLKDLSWDSWCKLQPNGFDCGYGGMFSKFFYDIKLEDCKSGDMGRNCLHQYNRFNTITECHESCRDQTRLSYNGTIGPNTYCRFQPDFGDCNSYHPRFYFDVTERMCRGFSYSGCGGNLNRFTSFQMCSAICMPAVDYIKRD